MPTARSNRRLYKIDEITVKRAGGAEESIVVKMKKSHAELFGLTQLAPNDPLLTGTFSGTGASNENATYRRKIGGFKELPFTFVAKTTFELTTNTDDPDVTEQTNWKSITIGFPKGASVSEVINWVLGLSVKDQIEAVISPRGFRHDISGALIVDPGP